MIKRISIIVLGLALLGSLYWGYTEYKEKEALLVHAENSYQRSFHELSYHMDLLHDQIGTSLAMNSGEKLSPQFVEIWRITAEALGNVYQLPLSLIPIHNTEQFLSEIGSFTYRTAIRDLDDDPLNEEEVDILKDLYQQAANIKDDLRKMQHEVLTQDLRWMDVELALATQDQSVDSPIIKGFTGVEESIDQYTNDREDTSILQMVTNEKHYQSIIGDKKSESEIKEYTKSLFDLNDRADLSLIKSGEGADIPFYSVYVDGEEAIYMDITEIEAHPISILVERELGPAKISLNDGLIEAENFLKQFGYHDMILLQSQQYDQIGVYSFINVKDDVRIYPDSISVQVALDRGDIIAYNAKEFLMNHHDRQIEKASISLEEARKEVNKGVTIYEEHLSMIVNELNEEVLTYEFLGEMNDETFRVFINAKNGKEERVEKLTNTEMNFDLQL